MRHEREAIEMLYRMAQALLLGLLLLAASRACAHTPESAGVPWDKAIHFSVGYVASDVALKVKDAWWVPVAVSATLAAGKEASDARWDWADFGATMAGCGAKFLVRW